MKWLLNVKCCGYFLSALSIIEFGGGSFYFHFDCANIWEIREFYVLDVGTDVNERGKKCEKMNILFYRFSGWKNIVYSSHQHMTLLWNEKCEPFVMDNLEYFIKTIGTIRTMKCVMSLERTEKSVGEFGKANSFFFLFSSQSIAEE